jgi:hypothetical protein
LKDAADPNVSDCNGNTPLHFATKLNNQEKIKSLSEYGAYYKTRNLQGKRPIDIVPNQETLFFLERQHRAMKQMSINQLKDRLANLEEKINTFEINEAKELKNELYEVMTQFKI